MIGFSKTSVLEAVKHEREKNTLASILMLWSTSYTQPFSPLWTMALYGFKMEFQDQKPFFVFFPLQPRRSSVVLRVYISN